MDVSYDFVVPSEKEYVKALKAIRKKITDQQRAMLGQHLRTFNFSLNFTQLAAAAGSDDYEDALNAYEALGKLLGDELNMNYLESVSRPGEPLYCSALASGNPFRKEDAEYYLVLHRELVAALRKLKWFK